MCWWLSVAEASSRFILYFNNTRTHLPCQSNFPETVLFQVNQAGVYDLSCTVTDETGEEANQTFAITVVSKQLSIPPMNQVQRWSLDDLPKGIYLWELGDESGKLLIK